MVIITAVLVERFHIYIVRGGGGVRHFHRSVANVPYASESEHYNSTCDIEQNWFQIMSNQKQ